MSQRQRGPGPVPPRWLHCPRKGTEPIVGKFIVCKTPLGSAFDDQVSPEYRFPPSMLFDLCKAKKIKIGLWIDLTNTSRFYNKLEIEEFECKYVKLHCRGFGETPSEEQTKTFISLVHQFISKFPLDCIAVHCTHGFNRTGYLIVSYLIQKMDCSIEIALDMFAKVRPPGIYKGDYLEELYRLYDDIDETPPPPKLPDWCNEEEEADDENDDAGHYGYSETPSSSQNGVQKPSKKRFKMDTVKKDPVFMEGVPGVTHFTDQPKAFQLQRKVRRMCGWKQKTFPGSQPVSMDKNNLKLLHMKPYRVSWKADGTRYMMLIDGQDEVYFFDRDHCIFKVKGLSFPHRKERRQLKDTLLDGEMVIDKFNGMCIPRYLAYDIIKFEKQDVGNAPFYPTRLSCIENEIIRPRNFAIENGLINKSAEPFSIRKKDFWHITQAANLLGEKFAKTLSHEPDGLIFQPSKDEYTPGRCDDVLKWKPPELNSVDFKLKIVTKGGVGIVPKKVGHLYVGQSTSPFAEMKYTADIKDYDDKIIECKFEDKQWKFMRVRTDKSFPNAHSTAMSVCETISNPVTKEKLLDYIERYRFNDDSELMPPPKTS